MNVYLKIVLIFLLSSSTSHALTLNNTSAWKLYVSVSEAGNCKKFTSPALYAVAGQTVYNLDNHAKDQVCVTVSRRYYWDDTKQVGATGGDVVFADNLKVDNCNLYVMQLGPFDFELVQKPVCR